MATGDQQLDRATIAVGGFQFLLQYDLLQCSAIA
jgi:hypothetical protein